MRSPTRARSLLRGATAFAILLSVTAASAMLPAVAGAPARDDPSSQQNGESAESLAPTMLVLDASGSMQEDDPSGGTRMDAAKKALHTVVDQAPNDAQLGLMAYGTTPGKVANDRELGCEDIDTLREVDTVDAEGKQALTSQIDEIDGNGYTPIGASLAAAAEELPSEGPRSVVLVSDGEDTCAPPPPCDVARELKKQGVDLTMHTVGFRVGKEARNQLRCIAEAGGGTYVDAPDAATLQEELPEISAQALRDYEFDGEEVRGTPDIRPGSPELGPGQYLDTLDHDQVRTYQLDVPEGFGIHASASAVVPRDNDIGGYGLELGIQITDSRGVTCSQTRETWRLQWVPVVSLAEQWTPTDNTECLSGGKRYLQIAREGPFRDNNKPYDVELQVLLEPPVEGENAPEPSAEPVEFEEPGGELESVTGGAGFNDATELPTESGRYGDRIGFGELTTYKVWLDWGQSLAVRAHARPADRIHRHGFSRFGVQVHGPTRQGNAEEWQEVEAWHYKNGESLPPIATPRVAYQHRDAMAPDDPEDDNRYEASYLAGWHYVTVWMRPERTNVQVPVELEVSIGGEKADPPAYEKVGRYPAGLVTSEDDLEAEGSGERGEGSDRSGDATEDADPDGTGGDTAMAADDGPGPLPWVLIGTGGVVLLGLTAGLLLARRRAS